MRLLDTNRVLFPDYTISLPFFPPLQFSVTDTPETVKSFFQQPKLGRVWDIERITVENSRANLYVNSAATAQYVAMNFELRLNDIPVAPITSLVYACPVGGLADLLDQNGPLVIEPFHSLQVNSGDSLSITTSFGIQVPLTGGQLVEIAFTTAQQLYGENSASGLTRR